MIGIFDSGVGGLTLVAQFEKRAPRISLLYLGDTARFPYGTKSRETLIRYSIENTRFLIGRGAHSIVIACNSASAAASHAVREAFPKTPVFDVVEPAVRAAIRTTRNGKIGVIGTRSTIRSGMYQRRIRALNPKVRVFEYACPLFAPLVEEGWTRRPETYAVGRTYLTPLKQKGIDTLILACTHYPALLPMIRDILGKHIRFINPSRETCTAILHALPEFETSAAKHGAYAFFSTDSPSDFLAQSKRFVRSVHIGTVQHHSV